MAARSPLAECNRDAAARDEQPSRRLFLQRSLTLGGLSLLAGCAILDEDSAEHALMNVLRFNDKVQGWLFDPKQLAPTYRGGYWEDQGYNWFGGS